MSENAVIFIKTEWRVSLPQFRINFKLKVKAEVEIKVEVKAKTNDQIKLPFTFFNARFKLNAILQSLNVICE